MSHFESDKNEKELKFKHTVITYHLFPASCHAQCQCFSNWVVSDNVVMTMQSHLATGHHHNWIYIQGTEKKKSHEKTWIFVFVEISKKKNNLSQERKCCPLWKSMYTNYHPEQCWLTVQKFKQVACYCCCFLVVLSWQLVFPLVMMCPFETVFSFQAGKSQ